MFFKILSFKVVLSLTTTLQAVQHQLQLSEDQSKNQQSTGHKKPLRKCLLFLLQIQSRGISQWQSISPLLKKNDKTHWLCNCVTHPADTLEEQFFKCVFEYNWIWDWCFTISHYLVTLVEQQMARIFSLKWTKLIR